MLLCYIFIPLKLANLEFYFNYFGRAQRSKHSHKLSTEDEQDLIALSGLNVQWTREKNSITSNCMALSAHAVVSKLKKSTAT